MVSLKQQQLLQILHCHFIFHAPAFFSCRRIIQVLAFFCFGSITVLKINVSADLKSIKKQIKVKLKCREEKVSPHQNSKTCREEEGGVLSGGRGATSNRCPGTILGLDLKFHKNCVWTISCRSSKKPGRCEEERSGFKKKGCAPSGVLTNLHHHPDNPTNSRIKSHNKLEFISRKTGIQFLPKTPLRHFCTCSDASLPLLLLLPSSLF